MGDIDNLKHLTGYDNQKARDLNRSTITEKPKPSTITKKPNPLTSYAT